jgi:hypothetical protein
LKEVIPIRNALVHGMTMPPIDPLALQSVLTIAARLLPPVEAAAPV